MPVMTIAIHQSRNSYSQFWIDYCLQKELEFKIVNCYDTDIISQLKDCQALMWHHYHASVSDALFAKQLLYSLELSGKVIYPDFRTGWHFNDKLGQKYLLESINAPLVPTYVFYSKKNALKWAGETTYPKVFKLRGGSGSDNVSIVLNKRRAVNLINKAFNRGFAQYNAWRSLIERYRKYNAGKADFMEVLKGLARLINPTPYSKKHGKECGYIYFQDFIRDNTHDIRVTYVYHKCFALRRRVRPGDFRASGGGMIEYDMSKIPEKALRIAFEVSEKLKVQTAAFDFVLHNGNPLIVEISYAFGYDSDQFNHGYWDRNLNYYPGTFNPYGWMVEEVIDRIKEKQLPQ